MTDFETEALEHLARAHTFRQELADAYATKPRDFDLIGALRMGVKFELETAQVYATLAATDRSKRAIEAALANMDRDRRQAGLTPRGADWQPGYEIPALPSTGGGR